MERMGIGTQVEKVYSYSIYGNFDTNFTGEEESEGVPTTRFLQVGSCEPIHAKDADSGITLSCMGNSNGGRSVNYEAKV